MSRIRAVRKSALNEAELMRLLTVARWRPLAEYGRETKQVEQEAVPGSKPKRSSWTYVALEFNGIEAATLRAKERLKANPELVAKLERLGRERALIYKTLLLTGLRKSELASITVAQLCLDESLPYLILEAADEKNGEGSTLPLRADLADDLRAWLETHSGAARENNPTTIQIRPTAKKPATDKPLFTIPDALIKILNRDILAAGIAKRDERGRTVDVRDLRHSFGTLLSKGGVAPRTAQAAMRHRKLELTMGVYSDPKLLDVAGAMDRWPTQLSSETLPDVPKATGTSDLTGSMTAPVFAPTAGEPVKMVAFLSIWRHLT